MHAISADLELAFRLADAADRISLPFSAGELEVEHKSDRSPVTAADRGVESTLRHLLEEARPHDAVSGEEFGTTGDHSRRWIIDPIDGTRNFARGIPIWATLLALEVQGEIQLGVVSAPALGRRWWAERGAGSFADGRPIRVSRVGDIEDAVVSFPLDRDLSQIAKETWHSRGFGDFWQHMLVAEGAVDGAIDNMHVKEWDVAAVQAIVEEAGGRLSDTQGNPYRSGRGCVTSNGLIHDRLVAAASGSA